MNNSTRLNIPVTCLRSIFTFATLSHPLAHQNGAANFSKQPSDTAYSSPHKQGRPPSTAPPKLGSQRAPRVPAHSQNNQGNLDFLNVPDQGMSGWGKIATRRMKKGKEGMITACVGGVDLSPKKNHFKEVSKFQRSLDSYWAQTNEIDKPV